MVLVCEEIEAPQAVASSSGGAALDTGGGATARSPGSRSKDAAARGSGGAGGAARDGGAPDQGRPSSLRQEQRQQQQRQQQQQQQQYWVDEMPDAPTAGELQREEWAHWQADDLAGAAPPPSAGAALRAAPPDALPVAPPGARSGEPVAAPLSPHKRHLSPGSDGGAELQDPAAKRAAASGEAAAAAAAAAPGSRSPSRSSTNSPGRALLPSVFAQPHVQAVLPAAELLHPEEMLRPPRPLPPLRPHADGDPSALAPAGGSGHAAAAHLALAGDRRALSAALGSAGSLSLPPAVIEGMPSTASLQGWLGSAPSIPAGSPSRRAIEGSGSFKKWIRSENSVGSFTLPTGFGSGGSASSVAPSLELEDSLRLDVQLLPPVVPEEVPADEEGEEAVAAAEQRQWERRQAMLAEQVAQAAAASIAAAERAFHAKIAGWEDELLGMLQAQMAPITIRAVVQAFKDRIHTERDKAEFKALCDRYTMVVEFPVSSGVKCLALKAWLQQGPEDA